MLNQEPQSKVVGQVIARAWSNPDFRARLIADPRRTLEDEGLPLPEGVKVKLVENTDSLYHLVLPVPPAEGELSESDFEQSLRMCELTSSFTQSCGGQ